MHIYKHIDCFSGRDRKWKYLKSDRREIQFQQEFDIAKIFPMCVLERRRPGLSKTGFIFAFHNLICVWECIKD